MLVKSLDEEIGRLKGVWFAASVVVDGKTLFERRPVFPAGPDDLWLMTIRGNQFHLTTNMSYHAGGRLQLLPDAGRLTFCILELSPELDRPVAYRLDGNELIITIGGASWSAFYDQSNIEVTRYVRVAAEPTSAMTAMMDEAERARVPWPGRS